MNLFKLGKYINHHFTGGHRKGYNIQPPFAFDFVRRVLQEDSQYYCFDEIEGYRLKLLEDPRHIEVTDFGAGSKVFNTLNRKIALIAKNCATSRWDGQLIFRIIQETKPQILLELGASLGIGTLYLGCSNRNTKVYTIEGCRKTAQIAQEGIDYMHLKNIKLENGTFREILPKILNQETTVDFVYMDGDHTKNGTLDYFSMLLPKLNSNSVVIMDDIYWSREMMEAWNSIVKMPQVRISFDIFHMGILFFKDGCEKQHYKVWV